jgi:DNA-binding HxlR family transcriptional regulator
MAAEPARSQPSEETRGASDPEPEGTPHSTGQELNPVELDRLIHGRVRLGIVSALAVNEVLSFGELKDLLETSDGNLSVHARRLEEGGYVECMKTFEGRMPRTEYRLTPEGRRALERYLDHMEALIERVREP